MKKHKFTLGAALIAASLVYLFVTSVEQSAATHMTLSTLIGGEANDFSKQRIQLGGCTVVEGSIQWDQYRHRPEFTITDGEQVLQVRYKGNGVLPDTFKDKALVVLEGHYNAEKQFFDAQVVFAKCPSKYEGQDYEGHVEAMNSQENKEGAW
jgi:cytochrome c-type biogenesis protein CcmE